MDQILSRLWLSFWHLLPANPILVRVVAGASRRPRHLWLRVGYLGFLGAVVVIMLIVAMRDQTGLNELAKGASQTFKLASYTQLVLMCFLAPIFTAGAITQERDAQTYNILLSTPLSNAQIVLGSLMSRLFFVVALLIAGLPIFCLTMVYGGVTTSQIIESFALAGSTAMITGALAILVSVSGMGSRRTIFSFYLLIALYLLALYLLGQRSWTWLDVAPANINGQKMSVLAALHPFLALEVSLNRIQAPDVSLVAGHSALLKYAWAYPSQTYIAWTLTVSSLLTVVSMFFVRRGAKLGEPTFFDRIGDRFRGSDRHERTRKPRTVWRNPVAWREAATKSVVGAGGLMRWAIIIGGAVGTLVLFIYHLDNSKAMNAANTRVWLAGIIMIEFAIALLVATNTAAVSMTKEKESKTIDILLATPLTSKYIIWGKLRGLVSFAAPLIAVPVVSLLVFGFYGLLPGKGHGIVWIETAVELGALMILYIAFVCIMSLRFSLTSRKTVKAVMASLGAMILITGAATAIGNAFIGAVEQVGGFFAPFTPFTAIQYLVDPVALFDGNARAFARYATSVRLMAFFGSAFAVAAYAGLVYSIYKNLVANFDMIVRKQSGT